MRLLFILLICLSAGFLLLQGRWKERNGELPVFLKNDTIAERHTTLINMQVSSLIKPDSLQQLSLKKDYCNLWAHLNYLYSTNNVEAGKEYYTEEWFKQLSRNYTSNITLPVSRVDEVHNIYIKNWADDGLVCTVVDSNAIFKYNYAAGISKTIIANLAMVLLYQGDHWRIDALRILNEKNLTP